MYTVLACSLLASIVSCAYPFDIRSSYSSCSLYYDFARGSSQQVSTPPFTQDIYSGTIMNNYFDITTETDIIGSHSDQSYLQYTVIFDAEFPDTGTAPDLEDGYFWGSDIVSTINTGEWGGKQYHFKFNNNYLGIENGADIKTFNNSFLSINQRYLIAYVITRNTAALYIDGLYNGTITMDNGGTYSQYYIKVGGTGHARRPYQKMKLYQYAFYAKTLSADEIIELVSDFNTSLPTSVPTDNPSQSPTNIPSKTPTNQPSFTATKQPSQSPTHVPSRVTTQGPTLNIDKHRPTISPTKVHSNDHENIRSTHSMLSMATLSKVSTKKSKQSIPTMLIVIVLIAVVVLCFVVVICQYYKINRIKLKSEEDLSRYVQLAGMELESDNKQNKHRFQEEGSFDIVAKTSAINTASITPYKHTNTTSRGESMYIYEKKNNSHDGSDDDIYQSAETTPQPPVFNQTAGATIGSDIITMGVDNGMDIDLLSTEEDNVNGFEQMLNDKVVGTDLMMDDIIENMETEK